MISTSLGGVGFLVLLTDDDLAIWLESDCLTSNTCINAYTKFKVCNVFALWNQRPAYKDEYLNKGGGGVSVLNMVPFI